MKMLWQSLVESGMRKDASESYNRAVLLTNHFIIIVTFLLLISAIYDVSQGFFLQSLATLIVVLLFTIAYVGIGLGYFVGARSFLLICLNFAIFFFDNYFGSDAGVYMYYSALLVGSAFGLAIDSTIRKYLLFILMPVALYAITIITEYSLIESKPALDNVKLYFYGNVFSNLGINLALVHIITKNNSLYNKQISKQNRQLISLNSSMDKFVHGVTHDLRAPISSVLGLINLSKTETDIEQLKEYNRLKEKSLQKMEEFIRDMLDYIRTEQAGLLRNSIRIEEIVMDIIDQLKFDKDLDRIDYSIDVDQSVEFYGDTKRIEIILSNLLSNSMRYADLKKDHPYVRVEASVDSTMAVIKVIDNGIGIAKENQNKIFEMFFRATTTKSGSGLGLYIVQETIAKMNGKITVDSIEGAGTTFTLTLVNEKERPHDN